MKEMKEEKKVGREREREFGERQNLGKGVKKKGFEEKLKGKKGEKHSFLVS